jgi:uncharacterized membrane protein
MSLVTKTTGAVLALAAAGLVGCASYSASDKSASATNDVHCYGVNKCKGQNDCKTASNACKGHASCKGQGFVSLSASACDNVGGKVGS